MDPADRPNAEHPPTDGLAAPVTEGPACVCWPSRTGETAGWVRATLPAEPGAVRALRRRVRAWVDGLDVDDELADSLLLAVDEAVTNSVEHACTGATCTVELVAGPRACGGGVAVLVADDGRWHDDGDRGFRGRGLALMGRLSDRSSVDAAADGTTVRLCWATPPPRPSGPPGTAGGTTDRRAG